MPELTRPAEDPEEPPEIERFGDDPDRVEAWEAWNANREAWGTVEIPARDAMGVFQRLYELHGSLDREREQFEVYAGDAILRWETQSGLNHHPLVLQSMQLDFEPEISRFSVLFGERRSELYSALLRSIDEVGGAVLARTNAEFEQGDYGPFSGSEIDGFLGGLAHRLHVEGVFGDLDSTARGVPRIYRRPLLFLRRRTQGFTAALEAIASDLPGREDLPISLRSIVGVHENGVRNDSDSPPQRGTARLANEEQDLLFTKPANDEQARIVRQLESHGAVMVQGPPGTGKTHTIANLIGHLLAKGKRVLVTSHTAKALERVREVIVEDLQPLAVSAVGRDTTERAQLEHSVREITNRLASDDASVLKKKARRLERRRDRLLDELKQLRAKHFRAIHAEYLEIVVEGVGVEPSDAAREVRSGAGQHDWIPRPVDGANLTLTASEIEQLYETNDKIDSEHERELSRPLPPAKVVTSQSSFSAQVEEESELEASDRKTGSNAWRTYPSQSARETIEQLARESEEAANDLRHLENWDRTLLEAGRLGGGYRQVWEDLLRLIEEVQTQAQETAPLIAKYGPRLPTSEPFDQMSDKLREICDHLQAGGKLNKLVLFRNRSWKTLLEACDVGMGDTREPAAIESLRALAHLQLAREHLRDRWRRTAEPEGMISASDLGSTPEVTCAQRAPSVRKRLGWYDAIWKPLKMRALASGLDPHALIAVGGPPIGEFAELERLIETAQTHLPAAARAAARQLKLDHVRMKLDALDQDLARFDGGDAVQSLRKAIRERNSGRYATALKRLEDVRTRLPAFEEREALLRRLSKVAPAWANAVKLRESPHDKAKPPGDLTLAWRWRVLNDELDGRAGVDLGAIEIEIERMNRELQRVTAQLVSNLAWAGQIESTSAKQKQSLIAWVLAMKRVGKGTGKRAPALLAAARKYMAESRSAVVAERVDGARNDQHENEEEAEFIVSAILAACELEEYRDATFGVISMLGRGDSQARLIESRLREKMEPADIERRQILVGSPAHFQGDERDVMFLSLVHSPKGGPLPLVASDMFKKRYNVAASRAKDQMWVVHSLNREVDLKSEDLRAKLIRHAAHRAAIDERTADQEDLTESPFEKDVLRDLVDAGYEIEAQHPVGALRIDLVAYGANDRRAAIECDGDRFHTLDDLDADLSRQALLERLGWRFIRVRGSEYYRDPEGAIARVRERLSELGVEPTVGATTEEPESSDLVDRVRIRAAEIRQSWREDGQSLSVSGFVKQDGRTGDIKVATNGESRSRDSRPKQKTATAGYPVRSVGSPRPNVDSSEAVRPDGKDDSSSLPSQAADEATPTDSKRKPIVDRVKGGSAIADAEARTGSEGADERVSEGVLETDVQMGFESLARPVAKRSRQSQLLRERDALKAGLVALNAQSGRPGRVNLASLIGEPSALDRTLRLREYPSSSTWSRKRAARKAIRAALAEVEAELASE
ncbi:MAG: AAA domain-containing protein [Chloroflexi bacterium]|nr:AAA domain-containing protein [Chloroflexota bacterium]MCY3938754.1 AAA domain-containing protein [Chloroflexota bacterium]